MKSSRQSIAAGQNLSLRKLRMMMNDIQSRLDVIAAPQEIEEMEKLEKEWFGGPGDIVEIPPEDCLGETLEEQEQGEKQEQEEKQEKGDKQEQEQEQEQEQADGEKLGMDVAYNTPDKHVSFSSSTSSVPSADRQKGAPKSKLSVASSKRKSPPKTRSKSQRLLAASADSSPKSDQTSPSSSVRQDQSTSSGKKTVSSGAKPKTKKSTPSSKSKNSPKQSPGRTVPSSKSSASPAIRPLNSASPLSTRSTPQSSSKPKRTPTKPSSSTKENDNKYASPTIAASLKITTPKDPKFSVGMKFQSESQSPSASQHLEAVQSVTKGEKLSSKESKKILTSLGSDDVIQNENIDTFNEQSTRDNQEDNVVNDEINHKEDKSPKYKGTTQNTEDRKGGENDVDNTPTVPSNGHVKEMVKALEKRNSNNSGKSKTSSGSVSNDRTSSGSVSKDRTSSGSVSKDRTSSGSVSKDRTSSGSVSKDRTSSGSVSKDRTSSGSVSKDRTSSGFARDKTSVGSSSSPSRHNEKVSPGSQNKKKMSPSKTTSKVLDRLTAPTSSSSSKKSMGEPSLPSKKSPVNNKPAQKPTSSSSSSSSLSSTTSKIKSSVTLTEMKPPMVSNTPRSSMTKVSTIAVKAASSSTATSRSSSSATKPTASSLSRLSTPKFGNRESSSDRLSNASNRSESSATKDSTPRNSTGDRKSVEDRKNSLVHASFKTPGRTAGRSLDTATKSTPKSSMIKRYSTPTSRTNSRSSTTSSSQIPVVSSTGKRAGTMSSVSQSGISGVAGSATKASLSKLKTPTSVASLAPKATSRQTSTSSLSTPKTSNIKATSSSSSSISSSTSKPPSSSSSLKSSKSAIASSASKVIRSSTTGRLAPSSTSKFAAASKSSSSTAIKSTSTKASTISSPSKRAEALSKIRANMNKTAKQGEVLMPPPPPSGLCEVADIRSNTSTKQMNNKRQSIIVNPFAEMISAQKKPGFMSPNTTKKQLLLQEEAKRLSGLGLEKSEAEKMKISNSNNIIASSNVPESAGSIDNDADDLDALVQSAALDARNIATVNNNGGTTNRVGSASGPSQVRRSGDVDSISRRMSKERSENGDYTTRAETTESGGEANPFGALL